MMSISTTSGGLKYILNDDCAVLVEKDNLVTELSEALHYVVKNKDIRLAYAQKAHRTFLENKAYDSKYYMNNYIYMTEE